MLFQKTMAALTTMLTLSSVALAQEAPRDQFDDFDPAASRVVRRRHRVDHGRVGTSTATVGGTFRQLVDLEWTGIDENGVAFERHRILWISGRIGMGDDRGMPGVVHAQIDFAPYTWERELITEDGHFRVQPLPVNYTYEILQSRRQTLRISAIRGHADLPLPFSSDADSGEFFIRFGVDLIRFAFNRFDHEDKLRFNSSTIEFLELGANIGFRNISIAPRAVTMDFIIASGTIAFGGTIAGPTAGYWDFGAASELSFLFGNRDHSPVMPRVYIRGGVRAISFDHSIAPSAGPAAVSPADPDITYGFGEIGMEVRF